MRRVRKGNIEKLGLDRSQVEKNCGVARQPMALHATVRNRRGTPRARVTTVSRRVRPPLLGFRSFYARPLDLDPARAMDLPRGDPAART